MEMSEIVEVLKNIRAMKTQTKLLMGIELRENEINVINPALSELSIIITGYLRGDKTYEIL